AGEVVPLRYEQREVIEPGVAVCGPGTLLLHQHEQLACPCAHACATVVPLEGLEPDRGSVVRERALEIRDREMHRAGPRRRGDLDLQRNSGQLEVLRVGWSLAARQRLLLPAVHGLSVWVA